jgi:hypothetical protein
VRGIVALFSAAAVVLFGSTALASTCQAVPYTLTNGSTADATQVMADFNSIVNCLNLNVASLASPTFTGTVTVPALTVTSAATFSSTLSASGATTSGGLLTALSGLTVSGGTTNLTGTNVIAGVIGSNRTLQFNSVAGAVSNPRWLVGADTSAESGGNAGSNFGFVRFTDAGAVIDTALGINRQTGLVAMSDGLTVGGGLAVSSGSVSLPAGSVANSELDTVNSSPGTYGSSNRAVVLAANAQGRITSITQTTITPDNCGSNGNGFYCQNAEGYIHEWGATGAIGGITTVGINLPFSCTNSWPVVNVTPQSGGTNSGSAVATSTSTFSLTNNKSGASAYNWAADCN